MKRTVLLEFLGIWNLEFGIWNLISPSLGSARRGSSIQSAAAVGELLEREAAGDEIALDF